MIRRWVDDSYATIGAREDIDGCRQYVVFNPDSGCDSDTTGDEAEAIELHMTAKTARAVARRLNRWAKTVSA